MSSDKILLMIGLAKKAGKITQGLQMCEKQIRTGNSKLIIAAGDISKNSQKAIHNICTHYKIKYIEYSTMDELANAVGACAKISVISINDDGFSQAILKIYTEKANRKEW